MQRKKMLPLTKNKLKLHQDASECYICRKIFIKKFAKDKTHRKVGDHCHFTGKYRGTSCSVWNLGFNLPNEIPVPL